jgi:hypothetical protein
MLAERACFLVCRALGRLLRSGRYARAREVVDGGRRHVHKYRLFYAPILIWIGGPLMRVLDTGVRVLPQREWEERERGIYRSLYGLPIRIDAGVLFLPYLPGITLAAMLDDLTLDPSARQDAIRRAVGALVEFHQLGFTHGDAMAENVLVDDDAARWFDFETVHESTRIPAWRRADDVRALLATCAVRTPPEQLAETVDVVLEAYADEDVLRHVAASFSTVFQRPLTFHLAQSELSFQCFNEVGRLLEARVTSCPTGSPVAPRSS